MVDSKPLPSFEESLKFFQALPIGLLKIYPRSFWSRNGLFYGMIRTGAGRKLAVIGEKESLFKDPFEGKLFNHASSLKLCDLSYNNTRSLMELFPFTRPVPVLKDPTTIGTGDRLGLATPGHIRSVRKFQVRPVFAQQSVRENGQTGRNFNEVIADAAWSVFQENYREGYGADGDHLKSMEEIKQALDSGASMITLDLSDKLDLETFFLSREAVERRFDEEIDGGDAEVFLHLYLGKEFQFRGSGEDLLIRFSGEEVKRNILLFRRAIDFSGEVHEYLCRRSGNKPLIDFEISIDEIPYPTSPETHLFLMIALRHRGVRIDSLAPRFIGEFQKGIDYRGEVPVFRDQFYRHALVAQHYGNYKLSIHSGSDKFTVFPHMGEIARGKIHLKTAGTSWLEAVRLISRANPSLYREMHFRALSAFGEASKHYHVTTDLTAIPQIETLSDPELPDLLNRDDARQLLHITYGFLLRSGLREKIFETLTHYEEDYAILLKTHMDRHLEFLGAKRRQ